MLYCILLLNEETKMQDFNAKNQKVLEAADNLFKSFQINKAIEFLEAYLHISS